jgi:uncharacterized membrane protein
VWKGAENPGALAAPGLLLGVGWFNLVEGIIDHQILGVHHVRPGPHQLAYDLGFLIFGALLLWGGRALALGAPG